MARPAMPLLGSGSPDGSAIQRHIASTESFMLARVTRRLADDQNERGCGEKKPRASRRGKTRRKQITGNIETQAQLCARSMTCR